MHCRRCDQICDTPRRDTRHRAPHVVLREFIVRCSGGTAGTPDPTKPSCWFCCSLGPSAIGTGPFPGSARTTAPGKTQTSAGQGALLVGGVARPAAGEGKCGRPSAEALSTQRMSRQQTSSASGIRTVSATARAGQTAHRPHLGPYPLADRPAF